MKRLLLLLVLCLLFTSILLADNAPFDAQQATEAYLARVPPADRARSDAYFEGGYWLILWEFLSTAAVCVLLLVTGWSAQMRRLACNISRFYPLQTLLYWVQFLVVFTALQFPLTVYTDYFREHAYGLSNQTFGAWFGDELKGLLVGLILGGIAVVGLFVIVRRLERTWWIWGAVASVVFTAVAIMIVPVYIAPLFNQYTKLTDARVRDPILKMARANGIAVSEVYQVDASRQSKRVSANVSGLMGTDRITLNDNLLKRCSLEEIEAVMGHEMGHYVMNHIYKMLTLMVIGIVIQFAFLRWALAFSLARWGERWKVTGIADPAVLPLALLLFAIFGFLATPLNNSIVRTQEYEADIFGLNAARQPDAEAEVDLKLGEYRKLSPGPLEEFIFFDHPSGRTRIYAAMRWKAENLPAR